MSKMADVLYDVHDLMMEGLSQPEIAGRLGIPLDLVVDAWNEVLDTQEVLEPEYDGFINDMEADADALASAGWGTDEDYGSFGGDDW